MGILHQVLQREVRDIKMLRQTGGLMRVVQLTGAPEPQSTIFVRI